MQRNLRSWLRLEKLEGREVPAAPVLMVIANRDFYYQEYGDTRAAIEAAGLDVDVAATSLNAAQPHWNSGQGSGSGIVMPDIRLEDADASDYSAIVFVGGWGASSYQYAFSGTYYNTAYNGSAEAEAAANRLINDFMDQDKYVAAICHGVSVLAWARVDGASPIAGRSVSAFPGPSPSWIENPGNPDMSTWHSTTNGAMVLPSRSIGDPSTATDDVWVDGKIITAENWDSAALFGRTIAERILADEPPPLPENSPPTDLVIDGPGMTVRGQTVSFVGQFVDPDYGDSHTQSWQVFNATGEMVSSRAGGSFAFTPPEVGMFTVRYSVSDLAGATASVERMFESRVWAVMTDPMNGAQTALFVGGSQGNDRIFFYVQPRTNDVKLMFNGRVIGTFSGIGRVVAYGQAGNDWIGVYGTGRIASWMDGGAGNDWLRGGALDDVLMGGDGNDTIWSGSGGRDVLIGGAGRDYLYRHSRNVVLIQD